MSSIVNSICVLVNTLSPILNSMCTNKQIVNHTYAEITQNVLKDYCLISYPKSGFNSYQKEHPWLHFFSR